MSTRSASLAAITPHLPKIKARVRGLLAQHSCLSREEIANKLGIRVSTSCTTVNKLMREGRVHVVGVGVSTSSGREVELLALA